MGFLGLGQQQGISSILICFTMYFVKSFPSFGCRALLNKLLYICSLIWFVNFLLEQLISKLGWEIYAKFRALPCYHKFVIYTLL